MTKKTNGDAQVYRLILLARAYNQLVDEFDARQKAAALGLRPWLPNRDRIAERLNTIRKRLLTALEVLQLNAAHHEIQTTRVALPENLFVDLGLQEMSERVRVELVPEETSPDRDEELAEAMREVAEEFHCRS